MKHREIKALQCKSILGILSLWCGFIRCVGGLLTCASVRELQLSYTAMFCFQVQYSIYTCMYQCVVFYKV